MISVKKKAPVFKGRLVRLLVKGMLSIGGQSPPYDGLTFYLQLFSLTAYSLQPTAYSLTAFYTYSVGATQIST